MLSGVAVGALAAGVGSILASGAVWCFGIMGANGGWGALVSGAFVVLAVLLGIAGIVLGIVGVRNIKRDGATTGRGYAVSGIACGGAGLLSAILGLVVALAIAQGS
jgi:Domain of unknown function (DUF4190)